MATDFRLISELCPIIDLATKTVLDDGLPNQLAEIRPRPESAAGQSDEEWKPWYFARVYGNDGIRFTEGLIAKQFTKPLEESIDQDAFALATVNAATETGVNPADLITAATFLSGIQNAPQKASSAAGPFLFNEQSWANLIAAVPDLDLSPSDRMSPDHQSEAAAAEAATVADKFRAAAVQAAPTAADLVFVRLFGLSSVPLLIQRAQQPGGDDPLITDVIAKFCSGEMAGTVDPNVLKNELSAFPGLLGSADAPHKVSEVLQALDTALHPLAPQAQQKVDPLKPEAPTPKPVPQPAAGNLKLGPNEVYRDLILSAAEKCDMDPAGLASLIDAEAAKLKDGTWNRDSRNPTSTAVGLTQFLKGTWTEMAGRSFSTLNKTAKDKGLVDSNNRIANLGSLLDLRTDPGLSITSAAEYAASNLKFVMNKNPDYRGFYDPKTPDGKMRLAYLCHHEGAGGALTYLRGGKSPSYVSALDAYIDRKIVPSRFRNPVSVVGPGPDLTPDRNVSGPSTSTVSGNGTIPNNVFPIPPDRPVDFSVLGAAVDQWHWPVITADTQAMKISYRTGPDKNSVAGKFSRHFLADRQGGKRFHVGMDIFCHQGDVVLALADGEILNFYAFYEGTNALFVAHQGVVVNYGEVSPTSSSEFNWKVHDKVKGGQPIARVGRLNMIHFETYQPGTTQNARWMQDGSKAPPNLLNPTKVLLGLAARGVRTLG